MVINNLCLIKNTCLKLLIISFISIIILTFSGCGHKGPLYLPKYIAYEYQISKVI